MEDPGGLPHSEMGVSWYAPNTNGVIHVSEQKAKVQMRSRSDCNVAEMDHARNEETGKGGARRGRRHSLRVVWWILLFCTFCVFIVFNPYVSSVLFPGVSRVLRTRDAGNASVLESHSSLVGDAFHKSQQEAPEGTPRPEPRRPAMRRGIKYYHWSHKVSSQLQRQQPGIIFFLFYDEKQPADGGQTAEQKQEEDSKHGSGALGNSVEQVLSDFQDLAVDFSSQPIFHVTVAKSLMHHWGYVLPEGSEERLPLALIVEMNKGWKKFILNDRHLNYEKMRNFEEQYFMGKLSPYLRSEPASTVDSPEQQVVVPLVGDTFRKNVVESKHDALVLFYAPWCGFCKRFEPRLRRLAAEFAKIRSIRFYKMDVTKNDIDHPHTRVERVPHVVLYLREKKLEIPIKFDHSVDDVVEYGKEFLLSHATCKQIDLVAEIDCDFGDTPGHEF
ncbi:thioredoxin domain-containing protein [Toxoplasma gondii TgCatPRC2]|uniref:Thioredoxin domain-containing protein n=5 Tax=Toxoplasma gondii TaxID=5811 RepID=A0A151HEK4_TOXGO|nr:thioredoxin domain-containing protein [Toxoplasma gondii MAS]KFH02918.1 thioredoxin domain-containing protein [Toxoplasma gondii VAND]KYF45833.1 thioredoxin domain-containing protein [Toxoplasma gondii ARI]KYK67771.1 thioredoxin domain-containing protein [Toxoplasma gondii TgCatPRC2]PIM03532.1 thioredoxin domain-containing protein [Toxoplasma gondii COUG]